jgi:UDP-glucose 4-epimerase
MVYGERDHQRREEPILRRVRAGRTRIPAGAGGWLWTRGYVRDVAAGIRLALESDATVAEVLNLGEARTWSMGMWARHVLEAAGSEAELVRVPDVLLPDDLKALGTVPQHLLVDSSKARDLLGWTETDPHEALARSVAWHLANPPKDADADFTADDRALAAS